MKVVDASAIACLLFDEPRAEEVAERLADSRLAAPTLLRYEVASVCRQKGQRHPDQREMLLAALGFLPELGIEELDVPADDVARLASELEITASAAAYAWLQQALDAELVTLDEDLEEATRF